MAGMGTLLSLALGESGRSIGGQRQRRQPGGQQPIVECVATGRYGPNPAIRIEFSSCRLILLNKFNG